MNEHKCGTVQKKKYIIAENTNFKNEDLSGEDVEIITRAVFGQYRFRLRGL